MNTETNIDWTINMSGESEDPEARIRYMTRGFAKHNKRNREIVVYSKAKYADKIIYLINTFGQFYIENGGYEHSTIIGGKGDIFEGYGFHISSIRTLFRDGEYNTFELSPISWLDFADGVIIPEGRFEEVEEARRKEEKRRRERKEEIERQEQEIKRRERKKYKQLHPFGEWVRCKDEPPRLIYGYNKYEASGPVIVCGHLINDYDEWKGKYDELFYSVARLIKLSSGEYFWMPGCYNPTDDSCYYHDEVIKGICDDEDMDDLGRSCRWEPEEVIAWMAIPYPEDTIWTVWDDEWEGWEKDSLYAPYIWDSTENSHWTDDVKCSKPILFDFGGVDGMSVLRYLDLDDGFLVYDYPDFCYDQSLGEAIYGEQSWCFIPEFKMEAENVGKK